MNSANGSDVVDGTEVDFINGLRLIWRMDTETHEGSGHTGVVVNNEHGMMGAVLLDWKEFDQEVVVRVFCDHNLPLVLTHCINNHVAQLVDYVDPCQQEWRKISGSSTPEINVQTGIELEQLPNGNFCLDSKQADEGMVGDTSWLGLCFRMSEKVLWRAT